MGRPARSTRQVFSVSKWTHSTARDLSKAERYRILASKLAAGEVVLVNNEKEASKLRATMRRLYPVVSGLGTPSHPPHKIESSENPKTKQITMS